MHVLVLELTRNGIEGGNYFDFIFCMEFFIEVFI